MGTPRETPPDDSHWRRYAALAAVAILAILAILFRDRIGPDLWPPDRSFVGPNLVAAVIQSAVVLGVVVLLYPPWRRAVHRFLDAKIGGVHEKLDRALGHHEEHSRRLEEITTAVAELRDSHAALSRRLLDRTGDSKSSGSSEGV